MRRGLEMVLMCLVLAGVFSNLAGCGGGGSSSPPGSVDDYKKLEEEMKSTGKK